MTNNSDAMINSILSSLMKRPPGREVSAPDLGLWDCGFGSLTCASLHRVLYNHLSIVLVGLKTIGKEVKLRLLS